MKRKTFLQSINEGATAFFVPKAFLPKTKAEVDDIIGETLTNNPNWRDTQKETEVEIGRVNDKYF